MAQASETIFALEPVTFHYKKALDPTGSSQSDLSPRRWRRWNPDLVVRDKEGKPYSVRYDAVNAMLLNEFLKGRKAFVEELYKLQELKANAAQQQKQIEVLSAGLQKSERAA